MRTVRRRHTLGMLALATLTVSCGEQTAQPNQADVRARALALELTDSKAGATILSALRKSALDEEFCDSLLATMLRSRASDSHAIDFSVAFSTTGSFFLRQRLQQSVGEDANLDDLLTSLPRLRLEMPSRDDRERWVFGTRIRIVSSIGAGAVWSTGAEDLRDHRTDSRPLLFLSSRPLEAEDAVPDGWFNSGPAGSLGTLVAHQGEFAPALEEDPCDLNPYACPPDPDPVIPPTPDPALWANAPAGVYIEALSVGYQGSLLPSYTEELGSNTRIEVQAVVHTFNPNDPEFAWTCAASHKRDVYSIAWNRGTKSYENSQLVDTYVLNSNNHYVYAGRQRAGLLLSASDITRFGQAYNAESNPLMIQVWEDDNAIPFCGDRGKVKAESDLKSLYNDFKFAGIFYKLQAKPSPLSIVLLSGDVLYSLLTPASHQYPDEMLGTTIETSRESLPDGTTRVSFELRAPPRVWETQPGPTGGVPNGSLTLRFVGVPLSSISGP